MADYLGTLGLCLRAGRLTAGIDAVSDAIRDGEVRLAVLSQDAGDSTVRRLMRAAEQKKTPVIRVKADSAELGWALGRAACAVCAVSDIGFAAAIAQKAAAEDESLAETARQLTEKNTRIIARKGKKKPKTEGFRAGKQTNRKKRGGERA